MSTHYHPFPATHWSLVRRAGSPQSDTQREALATLLTRYLPALRSHLRFVRRIPPDRADDLLQSFISDKLLERQLLQHADEARGRFRTFLLTTLNNFITSHLRARKEIPAANPQVQGLSPSALEHDNTPHAEVEAAWARALLHDLLRTMKDECERTHRHDLWLVFEQRILLPLFDNRPPLDYETLARQLHLASPTQAANLLTTAKRTYARLLRLAIAEYEPNPANIEEELTHLHQILATHPHPPPNEQPPEFPIPNN
ncbi:MAG: RNA polymerase sigma factor [Phycisphaerae bacterium]